MKIRKFEEKDLAQVLEICRSVRDYHNNFLGEYFKPQDDEFEKLPFLASLSDDEIIALIAEKDNEIVGLILAKSKNVPYLISERIVTVNNICVIDKEQKSGIGKMLMDDIYLYCKNKGIKEIELSVYNDNIKACDFYAKYGFKPLKQRLNLSVK